MVTTRRKVLDLVSPAGGRNAHFDANFAFLFTWLMFGALHAAAWNYEFPTKVEKIMWRVTSLTLAGLPIIWFAAQIVTRSPIIHVPRQIVQFMNNLRAYALLAGLISRLILVALMLASLRSLPSSAHEIISWTNYIPHL